MPTEAPKKPSFKRGLLYGGGQPFHPHTAFPFFGAKKEPLPKRNGPLKSKALSVVLCGADADTGAHGGGDYARLNILTLCGSGTSLNDGSH